MLLAVAVILLTSHAESTCCSSQNWRTDIGQTTKLCARKPGNCIGHSRQLVQTDDAKLARIPDGVIEWFATPVVVDWNSDGALDLIIGMDNCTHGSVKLITFGDNGVNVTEFKLSIGRNPAPTVVDWNMDGSLDLIVGQSDGTLRFFEQIDDSIHLAERSWASNPFASIKVWGWARPTFADWDGDGDLDLLIGSNYHTLSFFEQVENSSLLELKGEANPFHDLNVRGPLAPVVTDFDGDGQLDLILGSRWGEVHIYYRTEDGHVGPVSGRLVDMGDYAHPTVADWDGDGELDIIVGGGCPRPGWMNRNLVAIMRRKASSLSDSVLKVSLESNPFMRLDRLESNLAPPYQFKISRWSQFASGKEINNTAVLFLSGGLFLVDWLGGLNFQKRDSTNDPFRSVQVAGYVSAALVDWDKDGDIDLVLGVGYHQSVRRDGEIFYFEWVNGSFVQQSGAANPFSSLNPTVEFPMLEITDWDGNGDPDVFIGTHEKVFLFLNNNGTFAYKGTWVGGGSHCQPSVVDWNRDGRMDLLLGCGEKATIYLFTRKANGDLQRYGVLLQTGAGRGAHFSLDLNGDGYIDIVTVSQFGIQPYLQNVCHAPTVCSMRGLCDEVKQKCKCTLGHVGDDCSGCSSTHFPLRSSPNALSYYSQCMPCPGFQAEGSSHPFAPCFGFGVCSSNSVVRSVARSAGMSNATIRLAIGTGVCKCSHPYFGGTACSTGECKPGQEPRPRSDYPEAFECRPCTWGHEKLTSGNFSCQYCMPGWFSPGNGTDCTPCPPTTYQQSTGQASCIPCLGRVMQSGTACVPCPAKEHPTLDGYDCICGPGFLRGPDGTCIPCPRGGLCQDEQLRSVEGFWVVHDEVVDCPFGLTSCSGNNTCNDGYEGLACAQCVENRAQHGTKCLSCPDVSTNTLIAASILIPIFLCLLIVSVQRVVFVQHVLPQDPQEAALSRGASFAGEVAASMTEQKWEVPSFHKERVDALSPKIVKTAAKLVTEVAQVSKARKIFSDISQVLGVKFRIIILTAQAVSGWLSTLFLSFPAALQDEGVKVFRNWISAVERCCSWFSFDLPENLSLKCILGSLGDFAGYMLVLPAFFFLAAISTMIALRLDYVCKRRLKLLDALFSFLFWSMYLMYAVLTPRVVQHLPIPGSVFDCTLESEIGCRLREDYTIGMSDAKYLTIGMPIAITGLVLYCLGVPAVCFALLWCVRKSIWIPRQENETIEAWVNRRNQLIGTSRFARVMKPLFIHLQPQLYYFEVVNMLRQFLLNGVLLALGTTITLHILLSFLVCFVYLLMVLTLVPYARNSDNHAQALSAGSMMVLFVCQLAVIPGNNVVSRDERARELEAKVLGAIVSLLFLSLGLLLAITTAKDVMSTETVLRKRLLWQLRPSLEPVLQRFSVEWEDIVSLVDNIEDISELREAIVDPEAFLWTLAKLSLPLMKKMASVRLQPRLEPMLHERGLEWSHVLRFIDAIESVAEIQEALSDPEALMETLVSTLEDAEEGEGDKQEDSPEENEDSAPEKRKVYI